MCHFVWCVKYRRKVLTPDICTRLYALLHDIGEAKGFIVVQAKVGEMDHIHCFVSAPPMISITQVVKYLKGISGNRLLDEFPELRKYQWTCPDCGTVHDRDKNAAINIRDEGLRILAPV